jgi:hypothetical protein
MRQVREGDEAGAQLADVYEMRSGQASRTVPLQPHVMRRVSGTQRSAILLARSRTLADHLGITRRRARKIVRRPGYDEIERVIHAY